LRKGTAKRNVWALIIVGLAAALLYLGLQLQKMAEANKKVENTQAVELAKLNTEKKEAKVEKKSTASTKHTRMIKNAFLTPWNPEDFFFGFTLACVVAIIVFRI
jgi:periplasmic protein TonB